VSIGLTRHPEPARSAPHARAWCRLRRPGAARVAATLPSEVPALEAHALPPPAPPCQCRSSASPPCLIFLVRGVSV
jgi:hypothetical protein